MKRGIHPSPKWNARFKTIHNARHVAPKYKQLIYWITTDSLLDGRRILRSSPRGICPECSSYWDLKVKIRLFSNFFKRAKMSRNGWGVVRSLPSGGRACSGSLPLGGIVFAMIVLGGMLNLPPLGA